MVISLAGSERLRDRAPKPELQAQPAGHAGRHLARPAGLSRRRCSATFRCRRASPACCSPSRRPARFRPRCCWRSGPAPSRTRRCVRSRRVWSSAASAWCCSCSLSARSARAAGSSAPRPPAARCSTCSGTWRCPPGRSPRRIGRPRGRRRRIGLAFGIALAARLRDRRARLLGGGARRRQLLRLAYVLALVAVIVFTVGVVLRWIRRNGLRPTATRGWITDRDGPVGLRRRPERARPSPLQRHLVGQPRHPRGDVRGPARRADRHTAIQLQRLERYATTELARAEGEVNSWAEVTERLLAATSALSAAVTADDVAVLLTAAGAGAIEVDDAAIYLLEREGPQRFRLIGGLRDAGLGPTAPDASGYPVHRRAAHPHADLPGERRPDRPGVPGGHRPAAGTPGCSALAALPLVAGDTPVGALVLAGTRPREFRRLERELLGALVRVGRAGAAAGAALRAAVLAGDHAAVGAAAAEPALARTDVDLVGRYLPATAGVDVGGDWYDVLELGGSRPAARRRRRDGQGRAGGHADGADAQRGTHAGRRRPGPGRHPYRSRPAGHRLRAGRHRHAGHRLAGRRQRRRGDRQCRPPVAAGLRSRRARESRRRRRREPRRRSGCRSPARGPARSSTLPARLRRCCC